ncbi:MAG: 50S ribosomal protein L17, partial [Candidatus Omnitrophica bacterium]|nr:50S ribosomal protein L17 [Candidatus Omnitrophota bacterium]
MRHGKRRTKLSMMRSPRKATVRNMARAVLIHQRIETTLRRAKETRRLVDRLISMAKDDTVAAHRLVYAILTDRDMVAKLFKDIAPLFKSRAGGYTRIIPLGFRRGDGAQMAIL